MIVPSKILYFTLLREYPAAFGLKLTKIMKALRKDKARVREVPAALPTAEELFASMEYGDEWEESQMREVCRYLRGGCNLKIPETFRPLLPSVL